MAGYYGDAAATAAAFTPDGFLKSGDLGYTTAENAYVFQSRMGDVLRLAGFLSIPLEIEAVLDATRRGKRKPGVIRHRRAARHRRVAFVIARDDAGFDVKRSSSAHCAPSIARCKVPDAIPIDVFPFTPSANGNKVQKAKLREIADTALNR